MAPASTAASISLRETGLACFGMIPFSRDVGIFGRMITPSGWKKNLNRSPGLRCKRSRTALGMVALSFTAECGFHQRKLLHALHFAKSKGKCTQNRRAIAFILEGLAGISLGFYSAFEGG